ncbi:MAG: hypothetical protein ACI85K_002496 [Hyphomicrobiaceae bacterium]|jgi:hypothetical protein
MNDIAKTGAVLGAAALLTLLAITMKPGEVRLDLFSDQGEAFFPGFTSGEKIAELELTAYRLESSSVYAFGVKRDAKGVWTIPSHGDYPADASDQMGKAATMMIGLKKESVVGDSKGNHAEYDVVDPLAGGVETAGRGTRVKLKDRAGNVLADLIVGKEVEGKTGTYYCRLPDNKRVYKAKLSGSLSTQFTDWIETDLLKAESFNIDKVTFDNYSIDEGKGEIVPGEKLVIAKGADNKFMLAGLNAATEQTNEEKANEIGTTLGEIKIVGVRQKPQGLTARLERANSRDAQLLSRYLNPKGFFLAGGGKLVSNEGDLLFETKSGVRYTLRFGELVLGEGDEVTAGIGSDAPKAGDASKQAANNRYLMVTVAFDEALLEKPAGVRLAAEELAKRSQARAMIQSIQAALATYTTANEGKLPAALADLTVKPEEGEALLKDLSVDPWGNQYEFVPTGDTYVLMSHAADGKSGGDGANQDVRSDQLPLEDALATAATEWTTFDSKVETGREEAESLTKRFGPWYYVIDKALFDKLKPARADLVEPKVEEPKPGDAPK